MTIRASWLQARKLLKASGISDDAIEAEVLLRHAASINRVEFFASLDSSIPVHTNLLLDKLVKRRSDREPLAYIVGSREFYGLNFSVDSRVLIPRQETELLVEEVLDFVEYRCLETVTVADVGTGSGAIAISIAKRLHQANVFATDISLEALEVANLNRHKHGVSSRVDLLQGHLLKPLQQSVDVIVSNPPYIPSCLIERLDLEIRKEPRESLDGGPAGTRIISELVETAPRLLREGGMMVIEIDPTQSESTIDLLKRCFPVAKVSVVKDLHGLHRAVKAILPPSSQAGNIRPKIVPPISG
mgnify:CR=1 FL=1